MSTLLAALRAALLPPALLPPALLPPALMLPALMLPALMLPVLTLAAGASPLAGAEDGDDPPAETTKQLVTVRITPERIPNESGFQMEVKGPHGAGADKLPSVSLRKVVDGEAQDHAAHVSVHDLTILDLSADELVLDVRIGDLLVEEREQGVSAAVYQVELVIGGEAVPFVPRIRVNSAWVGFGVALIPVAAFLALVSALAYRMVRRANPLVAILSQSGRSYSLSKLQIYIWTLVIGYLATYVWWVTGEMLVLEPEVLVLLGISSASTLTSKLLAVDTRKKQGYSKKDMRLPRLGDLFSDRGEISLLKLQMLFWTLLVAMMVVGSTMKTLTFPEIDDQLLLLMGISHGTYIVPKFSQRGATKGPQPVYTTPTRVALDATAFAVHGKGLASVKSVLLTNQANNAALPLVDRGSQTFTPTENEIELELKLFQGLVVGRYYLEVKDTEGNADGLIVEFVAAGGGKP